VPLRWEKTEAVMYGTIKTQTVSGCAMCVDKWAKIGGNLFIFCEKICGNLSTVFCLRKVKILGGDNEFEYFERN
jgi:hypothetical protein